MNEKTRTVFLLIVITTLVGAAVQSTRMRNVVDLRQKLTLEYATTAEEHALGLGGRASLAPNAGMLFVFDHAAIQTFWMKDMRFPIDIIWIHDGIVKDVVTLEPSLSDEFSPAWHRPMFIADQVLEVNAGMAKTLGLARGVRVILPTP